jgi:hypothetical protein
MKSHFFILLLLGMAISLNSLAQVPSEVLRLRRCYALFTSKRIPNNHSLLTQVRAGSKSGTQACMELLDYAQLGTNNQVNTTNAEALLIIRKMQEVHRQFFEVTDYALTFDDSEATQNIIDLYEGANHLTYVLLKPNVAYSNIVTSTQAFRAIRTSVNSTTRLLSNPYELLTFTQGTTATPWIPSVLVKEGTIVGMTPDVANNTPTALRSSFTAYVGANVNSHKGAGILGSQAYLLGNIGKEGNPNATTISYRRWGNHVIKDFLCRDMPALRDSDVTSYVSTTSSISYRNSVSCNRCHATQDPLAGTIRNQIQVSTTQSGMTNVHFLATRASDQASSSNYPLATDSNYYRRPPQGDLRFRSYDGSLIDQPLTSLPDLGQKLAATNDLYVCGAKKYYKFLTGVDINLRDLGDSSSAPLSPGEQFHRNKIITLGLNFKNHQSVRTLLQEIISSPTFLTPYKVQ